MFRTAAKRGMRSIGKRDLPSSICAKKTWEIPTFSASLRRDHPSAFRLFLMSMSVSKAAYLNSVKDTSAQKRSAPDDPRRLPLFCPYLVRCSVRSSARTHPRGS